MARPVATGRTNRQVAAELYVSVKTVEFHLGHIFDKLGIRSRKDLITRIVPPAPAGRQPGPNLGPALATRLQPQGDDDRVIPTSPLAARPHWDTNTTGPQVNPADILAAARAAALFASGLPACSRPTGTQVAAAISDALRTYGGTRGCACEVAAAYGEYPETAAAATRDLYASSKENRFVYQTGPGQAGDVGLRRERRRPTSPRPGAHRHRNRATNGRARRHHRERRPAAHSAGARLLGHRA